MRAGFLALFLFGVLPAQAQQDPMELQRCVWSCLAASPGPESAEYNHCVAQRCTDGSSRAYQQASPDREWFAGRASDGFSWSAGIAVGDGSGQGVYYLCTHYGDSYLMLYGMQTPPGLYRLDIDGRTYPLNFHRNRQQLTLDIASTAAFLAHLSAGRLLGVTDPNGVYRFSVLLHGSRWAITQAQANCGN